MTIKRFIILSMLVHLIVLAVVYLLPAPKEKKKTEFSANLISPGELKKREVMIKPVPPPPPPKIRPLPSARSPLARRLPESPRMSRAIPPPPSRPIPSPERPVVPGEGKGTDKVQPEGLKPKAGTEGMGKTGEGTGLKNSTKPVGPGPSERQKLFDRGVTEEIARRDTGDSGKPGRQGEKDNPVSFDTKSYLYSGYMTRLREKIESIWVYPPDEAARGHYGDLRIRFTIMKDGRLGAVELERTSGNPALDKAAMKALRDGEPYWPLPDDWKMDSYTILGHFIYTLYGSRLR